MFPRVVLLALVITVLVPAVVLAALVCPPHASPWRGTSLSVSGACSDSFVQRRDGYVYNGAGEPCCTCDGSFRCAGSECQCRFSGVSVLTLNSANRTRSQCATSAFPYNSMLAFRSSQAPDCCLTWRFRSTLSSEEPESFKFVQRAARPESRAMVNDWPGFQCDGRGSCQEYSFGCNGTLGVARRGQGLLPLIVTPDALRSTSVFVVMNATRVSFLSGQALALRIGAGSTEAADGCDTSGVYTPITAIRIDRGNLNSFVRVDLRGLRYPRICLLAEFPSDGAVSQWWNLVDLSFYYLWDGTD